MSVEFNISGMSQRKCKRTVPDTDKDNKYWEKRKRNNLAAKRSRENKRKVEVEIRSKVSELEEENALLKKELIILKNKFGLSPEQTLITTEEKNKCMRELREDRKRSLDCRFRQSEGMQSEEDYENDVEECSNVSDSITQPNMVHNGVKEEEEDYHEEVHTVGSYEHDMQSNIAMFAPFNSMMWASANPNGAMYSSPIIDSQSQSESKENAKQSSQMTHCNYPKFPAVTGRIFTQPPFQYYVPYTPHSGIYHCAVPASNYPTNLSMKPSPEEASTINNSMVIRVKEEAGENNIISMDYNECSHSTSISTKTENQKLKMKILHLSAQVEEMKNIVLKE